MRNRDKRDDFIKKYGQERFESICQADKNWEKLKDLPLPKRYNWLWEKFISIWHISDYDINGNIIFNPRTILDYCELFKVSFTQSELILLFRMKSWAANTIYELNHKEG